MFYPLLLFVTVASGSSTSTSNSATAQTWPIVETVRGQLATVESLVKAQFDESETAVKTTNTTVEIVESNENARQQVLITFNLGAMTANAVLTGMTIGARQVNNMIDTAGRISQTLTADTTKLNRNIAIMDDMMKRMTDWVVFVEVQTEEMVEANDQLTTWTDSTKTTVNNHEILIIDQGREVDQLETDIAQYNEQVNSIGKLYGYDAKTLSLGEVQQQSASR